MINTILLHVGVHKTGTSTIQQSFGELRHHLAQNGFLYPAFRIQEYDEFNHSIPMVSMFRNDPEKYRINVRKGFTTKYAVEKLNRSYDQQLKSQIQNFSGQTLIISGEGISGLSIPELERLKDYLISITNPQVKIKILMVIRHPVKWAESRLQEQVKSGYSIEAFIPETTGFIEHPYLKILEKLKTIFEQKSIFVQRYEDLSDHANGLFAGFIKGFQVLDKEIGFVKNKKINQSIAYESATLLSAVYENFPFFENPDLESLLRKFNPALFHPMPGVRFQLSEDICLAVWEKCAEDVNALCMAYKLVKYTYHSDFVDNDKEKWGEVSTQYLASVIEKFPAEIVPVLLRALLSEIKKYSQIWSLKKKLQIFALVMFFSKYFQANSPLRKAQIIVGNAGLFNGFLVMTGYCIFKSRLIKPLVNYNIDHSNPEN